MRNLLAPSALALLLGACASPATETSAYWDGCISGYDEAGRKTQRGLYTRDVELYRNDTQYRTAWDNGYERCFREEERTPWMNPRG